jgi:YggT family protein
MEIAYVILKPILKALYGLIQIYQLILIARVIMSWFVRDYYSNPIIHFIFRVTEPVVARVRDALPFLRVGMFDFSIIVVFVLLSILQELLAYLLVKVSMAIY